MYNKNVNLYRYIDLNVFDLTFLMYYISLNNPAQAYSYMGNTRSTLGLILSLKPNYARKAFKKPWRRRARPNFACFILMQDFQQW